jgi:hypothetical protein
MLAGLCTPIWTLLSLVLAFTPPGCEGMAAQPTAGAPAGHRSFFVAPGGRDAALGTRRRPFRTLERALRRLRAGDRLYVRGGTYRERISVRIAPGTPEARVVVSNYEGERPVVKGQLWLIGPRYLTIRGIDVTRAGRTRNNLARVSGGTHWVWEDSEIWNARAQAGLLIDDGANDDRPLGRFTVRRNCIHDTRPNAGPNQDHNVYVSDFNGSPHADGLIERNIMRGAPNGRGIKFGPGDDVGGPHHVLARYNTIYHSAQNIGVSSDAHDITLERNLLVGAREGNVWSWRLRGSDNLARDNAGGRADGLLRSGGPSARPVADGGGNRRLTTGFDSLSCAGFHPSNPVARAYGRYAPTAAEVP